MGQRRLQGGIKKKKAKSSSRWAGLGRDGYGPILLLTGWLLMKKPPSETKLGRAKTLPGLLGGGANSPFRLHKTLYIETSCRESPYQETVLKRSTERSLCIVKISPAHSYYFSTIRNSQYYQSGTLILIEFTFKVTYHYLTFLYQTSDQRQRQ